MILCPFCAYINGLSDWRPNPDSYYHEHEEVPHGFRHLESSGGFLTNEFKVYPKVDSDMFDKVEMEIVDPVVKDQLSFLIDKVVCDICMMVNHHNGSIIATKELDEKEKLFRLYMRGSKK